MANNIVFVVYHYRGELVGSFRTKEEAVAFISAQKIPTEYYWERDFADV